MSRDAQGAAAADPTEATVLLRRILSAVERDRSRGKLELAIALILSLTSLATTWCGYQSKEWGNVQSNAQASANTDERQAAEYTILGMQLRTFDGLQVREYWMALRAGDNSTRDTVFLHMRPQLREAIEASIAAGILKDPSVAGPLQRPEYILKEELEAKRLRKQAEQLNAEAQAAGKAAGSYVTLTLMFASILFFGGIASTFTSRRARIGLTSVAMLLFFVAMALVFMAPVCNQ
jgi:hypothetical protein